MDFVPQFTIKMCGIPILENYESNMNYAKLIHDGYHVMIFNDYGV